MENKVLILSGNSVMKGALAYEIEKLGFSFTENASEISQIDAIVVDTASVKRTEFPSGRAIYILPDDSDMEKYADRLFLVRPFSMADFDKMLISLTADSVHVSNQAPSNDGISVLIFEGYITVNGNKIELTKNELMIFNELWSNKGKAVSRERLDELIGANRDGNMVTVYINHLREKLLTISEKRIIKTIRGGGYIISEP